MRAEIQKLVDGLVRDVTELLQAQLRGVFATARNPPLAARRTSPKRAPPFRDPTQWHDEQVRIRRGAARILRLIDRKPTDRRGEPIRLGKREIMRRLRLDGGTTVLALYRLHGTGEVTRRGFGTAIYFVRARADAANVVGTSAP